MVDSLAAVLAGQRRIDDAMGSAALPRPVNAQLAMIERLVVDARGPVRREVLDVAHQWAQFAGWLHTSAGKPDQARRWFAVALEWATEAGNADMVATVLSFQGPRVAGRAGRPDDQPVPGRAPRPHLCRTVGIRRAAGGAWARDGR